MKKPKRQVADGMWAATEAVRQSLTLAALSWTWRAEYAWAIQAADRESLRLLARGFHGVSAAR